MQRFMSKISSCDERSNLERWEVPKLRLSRYRPMPKQLGFCLRWLQAHKDRHVARKYCRTVGGGFQQISFSWVERAKEASSNSTHSLSMPWNLRNQSTENVTWDFVQQYNPKHAHDQQLADSLKQIATQIPPPPPIVWLWPAAHWFSPGSFKVQRWKIHSTTNSILYFQCRSATLFDIFLGLAHNQLGDSFEGSRQWKCLGPVLVIIPLK